VVRELAAEWVFDLQGVVLKDAPIDRVSMLDI
jgi:hypothetical protein